MSVYLDTSVVDPFFLVDSFADRARVFLATKPSDLMVSDLASAEFCDVVGRRLRSGALQLSEARTAIANFDSWKSQYALPLETLPSDIQSVEAFLKRLDLVLRAPDAIHISSAQRLGAELATFDQRMAECARALGVVVAPL